MRNEIGSLGARKKIVAPRKAWNDMRIEQIEYHIHRGLPRPPSTLPASAAGHQVAGP